MATTIPTRRPTQPPLIDQLRILYLDQQLTDDDIAAHYGVSTRTVTAWLRNAGIHRPRPSSWVASVPAEHLRELYLDQRLTAAQIAANEHVSTGQVRQALHRHQIRRGTRGPQPILPPPADELRVRHVDQRQSLDELAAHYHVSAWTVKAWLRNAGIRRHRRPGPAWATTVSAEHLRELYVQQRLTMRQIAARQRVTETTVWRALKYHQIPRRPAGRQVSPPPQAAELRRLYLQERWSIRQLAARYRVSYPTMRYRLAKANIPLRPVGGHSRWHGHHQPDPTRRTVGDATSDR